MTPPVATASETQARAIQALDHEFPQIIRRYQDKLGLDEADARTLWLDTKRFLYLCAMNPGAHLAPNEAMDDGWHEFLLYTRQYEEFCVSNFGRFIHHVPTDPNEPRREGPSGTILARNLAEEAFGTSLSVNWEVPEWALRRERRRKLMEEGALTAADPCDGCSQCDGCGACGPCSGDDCDGCSTCNACGS